MSKKDYINSIREEYSGLKDMPRESLASSVKTLADDLYAKDSHFIFELIQNAEDNTYADDTAARLRFEVCQLDIDGQKKTSLIVHNNEIGFNENMYEQSAKSASQRRKKCKATLVRRGLALNQFLE